MEPSRHTAQGRNDSGVPLGGIGAGKIEFCADGRFTNVTTTNNWDCPIIDGSARTPLMPRIKEGFEGFCLGERHTAPDAVLSGGITWGLAGIVHAPGWSVRAQDDGAPGVQDGGSQRYRI